MVNCQRSDARELFRTAVYVGRNDEDFGFFRILEFESRARRQRRELSATRAAADDAKTFRTAAGLISHH